MKFTFGKIVFPPLDHALLHGLGFNCHTGKYNVPAADWDNFLDSAEAYFVQTN